MGKKSKIRKSAARNQKPKAVESKPNPFEIRVNKQRYSILGRKTKKDRGLPGVARSKAIKKREQSLLKEYQQLNKVNSFVDRRIGENDASVEPEERALARFAKEWRKNRKNTMFNLNDENLTHMGKSLSEIDVFDDVQSNSEDESNNLSGEFIKKAHFGGFMTKNANHVEPEKSHKDVIQELIMETKKQKYERQSEREANDNLTEKLDEEWKLLQSIVAKSKHATNTEQKREDDSYDMAVKSLKFEVKGKPTDRLKTEEELLKEEEERIVRLEKERQERMTGTDQKSKTKVPHISADSLDDGFLLDPEPDNSENLDDEDKESGKDHENKCESDAASYHSDGDTDGNDDEKEDHASGDESDTSNEDIYTGMISDESDSDNEDFNLHKEESAKKSVSKSKIFLPKEVPQTLDDLIELLGDRSTPEKVQLVEELIANNHPKLGENNRKKIISIFQVLLQYVSNCGKKDTFDSSMINALVPMLYNLLKISSVDMSKTLLDMLSQKREEFLKLCKTKGRVLPSLDTLILFKLVSIFYPTSDFHHPVVTASELFMSDILFTCRATSLQAIAKTLFICGLFLEYVSYARRFVPEVLSCLKSILFSKVTTKMLSSTESSVIAKQIPIIWLVEGTDIPSNSETSFHMLSCCLTLINEFAMLYCNLPSFHEIFADLQPQLAAMNSQDCFLCLKSKIQDLQASLSKQTDRKHLTYQQKSVKCLKMYEPRLQDNFTGKKQRPAMSAKKAERQKLLYKYKKEFKGAVREIRKDNEYISRLQLNEQLERDSERKQKLKRLYQDLAQQEGEFKRFKKRRK